MFTEIKTAAGQILAPAPGQIVKTELIRAVRTIWVLLKLDCTVTLAGGPATAILNGGSPWALFDYAGTDENGTRYIEADPRALGVYSAMCAPRDLSFNRTRLTNTANGAYNLSESIWLPFTSNVIAAGPMDTVFLERNAQRVLSAFVRLISTNAAGLLVQTPGTAVVSNIAVSVVQRYDFERAKRSLLQPVIRQQDFAIASAASEFVMKIESTRYLQGMIVSQITSGAGEVSNIINTLALRADGRDFYGPSLVPYNQLQADCEQEFAGDVGLSRGYLPIWFRKSGRISNVLNPNNVASLRFVANVQPSVTAGAGSSTVRVTLLELEKVPGLTADYVGFQV